MRFAVLFSLLTVAGCSPSGTPDTQAATPAVEADEAELVETSTPSTGVAVVELFTSEGCSSCPSADEVLRDLATHADETGEPVIPLSFHVDYWNRLGWADPYSDAQYTARQRAYARAGAFDGRVYTPGMVVAGEGGFVGSRRQTADAQVERALAKDPSATVRLVARSDGRSVTVEHAVGGAPEGARLHLALVEDDTAQDVTRGENRGRRLAHARVVRAFETVAAGDGSATLMAPAGLDLDHARVVGYVQPDEVGPVLGAAQVRL
jgi:hypothetical protein